MQSLYFLVSSGYGGAGHYFISFIVRAYNEPVSIEVVVFSLVGGNYSIHEIELNLYLPLLLYLSNINRSFQMFQAQTKYNIGFD